ncbi:MAG: isoprenylcysteine carboxylmethyltransferase family protein [Chlorobi bacterium]|nr:isoprenylcysteine carboxylmethyltransferase family protein [Chlorobiota bacterium]
MFKEKIYPYLLVFLQLASLIYLLSSAPAIANDYSGILIEAAGIFLGIVAIYTIRIGNFNITPTPKTNGQLVTTGPYSVVRHPMYLAQLVALLPLVFDYFSWMRLGVFVLLIIVLLLKIVYEEKRLHQQFPDYKAYVLRTKRMLPYLY